MPHQDFFRYAKPQDSKTKISNLEMYRGDTFLLKLGLKEDGLPIDITNATIWFTVKEYINDLDSVAVIQKTTSDGISIINTHLGYIIIRIEPQETDLLDLKETKTFYWDLQYQNSNADIQTLFCGRFTIKQSVTRAVGPGGPIEPFLPSGAVRFTAVDYLAENADRVILVNTTLRPVTITLPSNHVQGKTFDIKDHSGTAAAHPITIVSSDGDTIDSNPSFVLSAPYQSITLVSDGNHWTVI